MTHAAGSLPRSGSFVWDDLMTSDLAAARAFYGAVFGWTFSEQDLGDGQTSTMFSAAGQLVGGASETTDVRPCWNTFVGVDSADDAVARARELGAEVLSEPMDALDAGRLAMLRDPAGAVIGVWEAKAVAGSEPAEVHGTVVWREARSRRLDATKDFYRAWVGWTAEPRDMGTMIYWLLLRNGDEQVAGSMQIGEGMGNMPSHWGIIFRVDDVDAAFATATGLGATVMMAPDDIPGVGRFAGVADPQGAAFGMLQPPG